MGSRMKKVTAIFCNRNKPEKCSQELRNNLNAGNWVQLLADGDASEKLIRKDILAKEAGVIVRSGGSLNGHKQCLHPCSNLNMSAFATAQWLRAQGIEPRQCNIVNTLPLHHVSGLLPWWRSRCWGAEHLWIKPRMLHLPTQLEATIHSMISMNTGPLLTSLVPTQLSRLIDDSSGVKCLQLFSVIWIGGASIAESLAAKARSLRIRLAPCYGATETAAMVTAQRPNDFLSGIDSVGEPLEDIELKLEQSNALHVRTKRLANILNADGSLQSIANKDGWWESGDAAQLTIRHHIQQLKIIGRRDTAINSGGETIFPEQLQTLLLNDAKRKGLPIDNILLVPTKNEEWGERLEALVKFQTSQEKINSFELFNQLKAIVANWSSIERPIAWHNCPELSTNNLGKWEIKKWQSWVNTQEL